MSFGWSAELKQREVSARNVALLRDRPFSFRHGRERVATSSAPPPI